MIFFHEAMKCRAILSIDTLQRQDYKIVYRITGPYGIIDEFLKMGP
jgi:hypothetical protein